MFKLETTGADFLFEVGPFLHTYCCIYDSFHPQLGPSGFWPRELESELEIGFWDQTSVLFPFKESVSLSLEIKSGHVTDSTTGRQKEMKFEG
jgi:hypothetical protein